MYDWNWCLYDNIKGFEHHLWSQTNWYKNDFIVDIFVLGWRIPNNTNFEILIQLNQNEQKKQKKGCTQAHKADQADQSSAPPHLETKSTGPGKFGKKT